MADAFDRDRYETRAAAVLARFFVDQRRRWEGRLSEVGHDPKLIGKRFVKSQAEELAAVLLLLRKPVVDRSVELELNRIRAGLREAGKDPAEMELRIRERAARETQKKAAELGTLLILTTLRKLEDDREAVIGDPATRKNRLRELWGSKRAESVSIGEVTGAKSTGIQSTRAELAREELRTWTYWRTKRDDRVCPVCDPLDGTPQRVWEVQFPDGPPAHPRCRCDLEIRLR